MNLTPEQMNEAAKAASLAFEPETWESEREYVKDEALADMAAALTAALAALLGEDPA